MAQRFDRTLKERLWVYMTNDNDYRYIEILQDVVKGYNATEHSSTGYAPKDVTEKHVPEILGRKERPRPSKTPEFKVGDLVRVSTSKRAFVKGYEANYSEMIFKITEVRQSDEHYLYKISDLADKIEPGWLYEKEMSKVRSDEKLRIAKIVRQRTIKGRKQYLVGYPSTFDSWQYADELT